MTYLDDYKSVGTHWIALYVRGDNWSTYYDAPTFTAFKLHIFCKILKIHKKETYNKLL